MERTGAWQRIVQFARWQPSTYRQVWLLAFFGGGVLMSVAMSVFFSAEGQRSWLGLGLICGASIFFINGTLGSWSLNRRRNQGL